MADHIISGIIPYFSEKLKILYALHPTINTNKALASALNIEPHNISTWCTGTDTRRPNKVPINHIKKILDIFHIDLYQLELDTIEDFKKSLYANNQSDIATWKKLEHNAEQSCLFHIQPKKNISGRAFGLSSDEQLERFIIHEEASIILELDDLWEERAKEGNAYIVIFNIHPKEIQCICPSKYKNIPEHKITSDIITIPVTNNTQKKYIKITEPFGKQVLYALLLTHPLPETILQKLVSDKPIPESALNKMGEFLENNKTYQYQIIKKPYEVVAHIM